MCLRVTSAFFLSFSPLNIYISLFRSLPAPFPCCRVPLSLPRRAPPSFLLPSLRLSSAPLAYVLPCVLWLPCRVSSLPLSPFVPIWRAPEAPRRPSVCRAACPLLVHRQAQDAMTVWANTACIYLRPYVLLSMCCRCPFRVSVCVLSCLLPCVFWW